MCPGGALWKLLEGVARIWAQPPSPHLEASRSLLAWLPLHPPHFCFGGKPTFVFHSRLPSPLPTWMLPVPKAALSLIWMPRLLQLLRGLWLSHLWVCGPSGLCGPRETVSLATVSPSQSCQGEVCHKERRTKRGQAFVHGEEALPHGGGGGHASSTPTRKPGPRSFREGNREQRSRSGLTQGPLSLPSEDRDPKKLC